MIVLHTTLVDRVSSILSEGVCVRYSASDARRVWVHAFRLKSWARTHVCDRHRVGLDAVISLELAVPEHWLTRFRNGVWYCDRDIPPSHVMAITFAPHQWGGKLS